MARSTIFLLPLAATVCFALIHGSTCAQQSAGQPVAEQQVLPQQSLVAPPAEQPPAPNVAQVQTIGAPVAQVASVPAQPGQPGPAAPQRGQIGPPFQLDDVEQQFVDQILQMWETESAKIKTFDSRFERWEYDPVFGPGGDTPSVKSVGQLTYSKPDKGSFKINEIRRYKQDDPQQPGDWVLQKQEIGEHWVCDGKAIFEYKHDKKQLVVQPLPPDMRGKSIVDGPLPFLFGAEAEKLKRRYWIRSKTSNAASIHLEAWPRSQADAANYQHVDVMLDRKTMTPGAIQVHMPNGQSRAVYMFQNPTVNGKLNQLFGALFNAPRTPLGWTRVVQEVPAGPQPPGPQAATPQETSHR